MRAARTRPGRPIGSDASPGWTVCFSRPFSEMGKGWNWAAGASGEGGQGQNLGKLEDEDASRRCAVSTCRSSAVQGSAEHCN